MAAVYTLQNLSVDVRQFTDQLAPRKLGNMLKASYRKEARRIRRQALSILRQRIHMTPALEKTVRAGATRDARGFYVSVSQGAKVGSYKSSNPRRRNFRAVPVLQFMQGSKGNDRMTRRKGRRGVLPKIDPLGQLEGQLSQSANNIYRDLDQRVLKLMDKLANN